MTQTFLFAVQEPEEDATTEKSLTPVLAGALFAPRENSLTWVNGDVLVGEVIEATADTLVFQSPLFAGPLTLDMKAVSQFDLAASETAAPESMLVALQDGSAITGVVSAITDDVVHVRSRRFGGLTLKRAEVSGIRQLAADAVENAPAVLNPPKPDAEPPEDGLFVRGRFPELVDIVLAITLDPAPSFKLEIAGTDGRRITLETTGGDLVLQGREFASLRHFPKEIVRAKVHLFWDQTSGRTVLYAEGSGVLAETNKTPVKTTRISTSGLLIHNKTDRAVEFLGMNAWDGEVPRQHDRALPGLRLALGKEMLGEVISADEKQVRVQPESGAQVVEVPWSAVVRMRFRNAPTGLQGEGITELWFNDGGQIKGRLASWKDGVAMIKSRASDEVVHVSLDGLSKVILPGMTTGVVQDGSPFERQDEVSSGNSHLHGSLAPGEDAVLRWRVPGTHEAAALHVLDDLKIRCTDDEASPVSPLFFLKNGEVLPGTLAKISADHIEVLGGCAPRFRLKDEWMRAIQFSGDAAKQDDFSDANWAVLDAGHVAVPRTPGGVLLRDSVVLSHPAILQGNQLEFFMQPPANMTVMRVRLFCQGNNTNPGNATTLLFRCFGSEIHFGMDDGGGGFLDEWTKAVHRGLQHVPVRIRWEEGWLFVTVNDSSTLQLRARPRNGIGLRFEIESAGRFRAGDNSVALSGFKIGAVAGQTWMPTVSAEAKTHALTVPRFRKDDPPLQALIATNRDVLRGGIESATADHLMFRSGLSTFRIAADRVAAAVWLRKPGEGKTTAAPGINNALMKKWLLLKNGAQFALEITRVEEAGLYGTHPMMGICRVPLREVQSITCRMPDITPAMIEFDSWQLQPAPEPAIPDPGTDSPMLGKVAGELKMPFIGGGEFHLSRVAGKVVVLDFWATWCGPCIKSLPEMIKEMSVFSTDKVLFIGVNQGESAEIITTFLQSRGWSFPVALDKEQKAGAQFGATGIPHTVIIDASGRIAWVKTGYSPDAAKEAAAKIQELLTRRRAQE